MIAAARLLTCSLRAACTLGGCGSAAAAFALASTLEVERCP